MPMEGPAPTGADRELELLAQQFAVGLLVTVVYELLDAHDDMFRLAVAEGLEDDPRWAAHLDYIRCLQRLAREDLALATTSGEPRTEAP
jgi:hypothetical protein